MAAASGSMHISPPALTISQSWQAVEQYDASSSDSQHGHGHLREHHSSPPGSPASVASIPTDMLSDLSRANSPLANESEHDHYEAVASVSSSEQGSRSRLVMPKIDIDLPRPGRVRDEGRKSLRVAIVGGTG
jgi:hypothetical protein